MLSVAIVLLLLILGFGVLCLLTRMPKTFEDAPRDVLMLVAHSDDCVIIGAEYAYGAVSSGRSVSIVYLTCSGPNLEAEISQTRKNEALKAWSILGVPANNLTFLNLRQSNIGGPTYYSAVELENARHIFKSFILGLPKHAAIIIPARGELHVDHRTVRQLALEALHESNRTDIIIYESPEYNDHLSLLHAPERTMRVILRHIPASKFLIAPFAGSAGYVDGSTGRTFRNPTHLAKKKEMLMYFESQDGKLLVDYFGYATPYRVLKLSNAKAIAKYKVGFRAFGHVCDLSALLWGFCVGIIMFLMSYTIGVRLSHVLTQPFAMPVSIFGVLGGCTYIVSALRKRVSMETAFFACSAGFGLAIAVIWGI